MQVHQKLSAKSTLQITALLTSFKQASNTQTFRPSAPHLLSTHLVLLPSGYTTAEKAKFATDVDHVTQLFKFPPITGFKASVPFYRYFDVVNVFSVWQPSPESGASKPADGITKSDNLGCGYGKTNPRYLFCDTQKVLNLAETSPAKPRTLNKRNTVIAVLVNDNQYGGGGLYSPSAKIGCFYNGFDFNDATQKQKFASLLFHELGHAWGDLFDEYDMQITEPSIVALKNCVSPQSTTIPWQGWIDKSTTDTSLNMLANPVTPCGYSNYKKPSTNCLMGKLTDGRMCPVCREAVTLEMYASTMSLMWPSCPLPDEIVHLATGQSIVLHLNAKLLSKGNFGVSWAKGSTAYCTQATCGASIEITAGSLGIGDNIITATVTDLTDWVLQDRRVPAMTQTRDFTIKVVPAINNSTGSLSRWKCYCTDESLPECRGGVSFFQAPVTPDTGYVAECKPGGNCTLNFSTTSHESTGADAATDSLEKYESYVLYLGIGAGVSALMLWCKAWTRWRHKMNGKVRPIFKVNFKKKYVVIRNIMMGTAVVIMIMSMATLGVALYLYTQFDGLGKWLLVPGGITALVLYIIAFLGFWAAWYRSKYLLGVNGVVLILCLGATITIAYFSKWFSDSVGDDSHSASTFLKDLWEDIVTDYPSRACAIEKMLSCSGYEENCQRLTSTLHCPDNCEATNAKYSDACKISIQEKIEEYFPRVFSYSIVVGVCLLIGIVFNFMLCYALRGMEKELKEKGDEKVRKQSIAAGNDSAAKMSNVNKPSAPGYDASREVQGNRSVSMLKGLDREEKIKLAKEFQRYDKTNSGTMDKKHFKKFMNSAFGYTPSDHETDQIFLAAGGKEYIQFNEVIAALGGNQAEYQGLLHEEREQQIRKNFDALEKGDIPEPPSQYSDSPHLPDNERHRRWELRDHFNKGLEYGSRSGNQIIHEVSLTKGAVGLDYDTNQDLGVYAVAVEGPCKEAGIRSGDIITTVDGVPVTSAADMQRGFNQAKGKGLKTVTVVTKQIHANDSPMKSSATLKGSPPEWGSEAHKVAQSFLFGAFGLTNPSKQQPVSTAASQPRPTAASSFHSPPLPVSYQSKPTPFVRTYATPRYISARPSVNPSPAAPPGHPVSFSSPYITNPSYAGNHSSYQPLVL
eukprot:TRINITY_DN10123_c0_g2_i2.p1 TRINITY_DN10123_c0_g2~~TRINITY_DN10123_c0_g2_i2.p1  ORF type:complete len:1138 (+),score=207.10 TRINITY_DN10123_c0_g2_i2:461-3874(+)